VFKLTQSPTSDSGTISVFYNGDQTHTGFDNVTFFSRDDLAFVEDAGDTLYTQRNAFDSAYMPDVTQDYSHGAQPVRFIAEGRDASATIDSETTGTGNEGDNEITEIHVSDGGREHARHPRREDPCAVPDRRPLARLLDAAAR
jgi:hypothetical protein